MKKIEDIIKAEPLGKLLNGEVEYSDEIPSYSNEMREILHIDKLLNGEVKYSDETPSSSNEMRGFLPKKGDIPLSLIKMMYWDGSIDKTTHEQYDAELGDFLPYKVYKELIFADEFPEEKAKDVLADSDLLDCLIELRLCLPSEAKEEGNEFHERYCKFTRLIFLLYCESLRLEKPEKRLRSWAMEGFKLFGENDTSLTALCKKDEEFFLICKARDDPARSNAIFGIEQVEESGNEQESISQEKQPNYTNDSNNWLYKFFDSTEKKEEPNGTAPCMDNM